MINFPRSWITTSETGAHICMTTTSPYSHSGHGLSYTNFEYSGLKIDRGNLKKWRTLHVTLDVKNTGVMNGDEVVQIYVSYPDSKIERPVKSLKGFKRIHISKDSTVSVTIPIKAEDLTYWDTSRHNFLLEKGAIKILVGAASDDIRLNGEVEAQ